MLVETNMCDNTEISPYGAIFTSLSGLFPENFGYLVEIITKTDNYGEI